MTKEELRTLVRAIVADRLRQEAASDAPEAVSRPDSSVSTHASHAIYVSVLNVGDACVIEPDVACNHCGYCKSHGH